MWIRHTIACLFLCGCATDKYDKLQTKVQNVEAKVIKLEKLVDNLRLRLEKNYADASKEASAKVEAKKPETKAKKEKSKTRTRGN